MDDVLNQIEEKVKRAISTINGLKTRIRDLETENGQLRAEMQDNQAKLTHMLEELSHVDDEDAWAAAPAQHDSEPPLSEPPAWEQEESSATTTLVSEILLETPGYGEQTSLSLD